MLLGYNAITVSTMCSYTLSMYVIKVCNNYVCVCGCGSDRMTCSHTDAVQVPYFPELLINCTSAPLFNWI